MSVIVKKSDPLVFEELINKTQTYWVGLRFSRIRWGERGDMECRIGWSWQRAIHDRYPFTFMTLYSADGLSVSIRAKAKFEAVARLVARSLSSILEQDNRITHDVHVLLV